MLNKLINEIMAIHQDYSNTWPNERRNRLLSQKKGSVSLNYQALSNRYRFRNLVFVLR